VLFEAIDKFTRKGSQISEAVEEHELVPKLELPAIRIASMQGIHIFFKPTDVYADVNFDMQLAGICNID
jgi:hypothetical protein